MNTKDRVKAFRKRRQKINKRFITVYLGKRCLICGEQRMSLLRTHEKNGIKHPAFIFMDTKELVEVYLKTNRVVRVCERCHRRVHSLMDRGIISWDEARYYIGKFVPVELDYTKDMFDKNKAPTKRQREWAWEKFRDTYLRNKQLEFPFEVEIVPTELEKLVAQALEEERLHHNEVPCCEGSLIEGWDAVT